jgi:hypothetical protein
VAEVLREVLEIGRLVPLDVLQGDELALLLVGELVDENLAEYLKDGRVVLRRICSRTSRPFGRQPFAEVLVIDNIDEIDDEILESKCEHPVDGLVVLRA